MSRRFSAVLFDLDDTLHDDTAAYHSAAERTAYEVGRSHGADPKRLRDAYVAEAERFWTDLNSAMLDLKLSDLRTSMWGRALAGCGIDDPELSKRCADAYNRYRAEVLAPWPGVLDMLARLRAHGLRLGIVTNGFAETHREKIALLDLEGSFDGIFIADEIGAVKPDPRFFLHAAEQLRVSPESCAVVGDRYQRDIAGAHAAGMYAIWLNVRGETLPADAPPPDATVERIGDVEALLAGSAA